MKNLLLYLLLLLTTLKVEAQKIPDFGFNKIRIAAESKIIQAELRPVSSDPSIATDKYYYWYSSNTIHTTQGGFSGRLLNGNYTEYYLNKNLKQEGIFNKGLKNGIWKDWDESGQLVQLYNWRKGVKDGKFNIYYANGNLKQQGSYADNLLNGKVKTYDESGTETIINYKAGKVIIKKPSKFWQKINFFKKKNKSPNSNKSIPNNKHS